MAKILIVDDSNLSRRITRRILEEAGHSVIEAEEGIVALERYSLEKPAAVLLDMTMKGMNGLEVLKNLRAMDPQARVVIATADIQASTRTLTQEGGACGFVSKPFNAERVVSAIAEALGKDAPCN